MLADPSAHGTPLVRLARLAPDTELFAKLESLSPTGSVWDRIATRLLDEARPRGPIVVAGSGSMALAFASAADRASISLTVVCPESLLFEHRALLREHTATFVSSDARAGLLGTHDVAERIAAREHATIAYSPRRAERAAHHFKETVGRELVQLLDSSAPRGPIAIAVPIGSGALARGIQAAFVEASKNDVHIVGSVRPDGAIESEQQGVVQRSEAPTSSVTHLEDVTDRAAFEMRMRLARSEGILVGMGSAAAASAALAFVLHTSVSAAVAVFVDAGDRYFSVDARMGEAAR